MSLRNIGKQLAEDGTKQFGEQGNDSSLFAYLHNTQPQGEYTRKAQRNLESGLRTTEGRVDNFGEHLSIAKEHQSEGSDDKGYQKESYPNIIEYHKMLLDWFGGQKYKILNKK